MLNGRGKPKASFRSQCAGVQVGDEDDVLIGLDDDGWIYSRFYVVIYIVLYERVWCFFF